jgi:mRNA interferase RelE/StbE
LLAVKTVRYTPDALKSLKRHSNVANRIRKALDEYAAETSAHANSVTRLVGSEACRLRVGDFQVIFEESETDLIVTKIAPRGSVCD